MLKLSTLLSKLDFSTMGDLRADLVGEAERLEGMNRMKQWQRLLSEGHKPDGSGNCPTQYISVVELDCEIEWAIYGTGGNVWLSFRGGEYTWRNEIYHAKRFASKKEAQVYINAKSAVAIPFPVPKIKEQL